MSSGPILLGGGRFSALGRAQRASPCTCLLGGVAKSAATSLVTPGVQGWRGCRAVFTHPDRALGKPGFPASKLPRPADEETAAQREVTCLRTQRDRDLVIWSTNIC